MASSMRRRTTDDGRRRARAGDDDVDDAGDVDARERCIATARVTASVSVARGGAVARWTRFVRFIERVADEIGDADDVAARA